MMKKEKNILYSSMNKKAAILILFVLLCSLCACVSSSGKEEKKQNTEQTVQVEKKEVPAKTPPPLSNEEKWEKSIRASYGSWQPAREKEETHFAANNNVEYANEGEICFGAPAVSGEMPAPAVHSKRAEKRPSAVHTVVKGETLWGIAHKYYGKGWKWEKIRQANRDRLKKDTIINPGLTLVIPAINEEELHKVNAALPEKNLKANEPAEAEKPAADSKQGNKESHTGNQQ